MQPLLPDCWRVQGPPPQRSAPARLVIALVPVAIKIAQTAACSMPMTAPAKWLPVPFLPMVGAVSGGKKTNPPPHQDHSRKSGHPLVVDRTWKKHSLTRPGIGKRGPIPFFWFLTSLMGESAGEIVDSIYHNSDTAIMAPLCSVFSANKLENTQIYPALIYLKSDSNCLGDIDCE